MAYPISTSLRAGKARSASVKFSLLPLLAALGLSPAMVQALEEVVVTSERLEETLPLKLERYGNQVEVITADDISNHGFVDLADALKTLVPGLHISPKNGPFDYFNASLQGSRSKDILWLVDGVRITNRLYNGTSPLDTIPPHMVERVEILKGGQGIFYGTQSVGGVINIVTKSFSNKTEGEIGTGANSNDGYNLNGFIRGGYGEHQYVVYASKDYADGYNPYDDNDVQPSATDLERGYDVKTVGTKYAWEINENVRLSAQYQLTNSELDFARPFLNRKTINDRSETLAAVKLESRLTDFVELFIKAYRHTWDTDYTRIYNELDSSGVLTGGIEVRNDDTYWGYEDYGINAMTEISWGDHFTYVVGFDQQNFSAEDDVWRVADQKERVNAVFAQVRTNESLFEGTMLAFGVRKNRPSDADSSTIWNLTAKHNVNDVWYFQGNVGTSFRLPDAEALFLNEYYDSDANGVPDGGWFAVGNPDLKPEKSKNLNLSVGAILSSFQFELTVFKRDITDYIASVPLTIAGVVGESFENSDDEVNIEGVELSTVVQLNQSLSTQISYTHTRALFNDEGEQLKNIPEHQAKLSLDYRNPGSSWGASLNVNHVGKVNDTTQRDRFTVADVSAFYAFGERDHQRIIMRLENLADASYVTKIGRGTEDVSGNSYLYRNFGMKRTLHLSYRYQF